MRISRVVIRNFRCFKLLDVSLHQTVTCIIGENNTGKTGFLHAIRICLDANLPSTFRSLAPHDIHSAVDISHPTQVLIGIEITDYEGNINEEALVSGWQVSKNLARLVFRFRPKLSVREELEAGDRVPGDLRLSDYQWEIVGGGDPKCDLRTVNWDDDIAPLIRFSDLQAFQVVYLPALRDVEGDLRNFRMSPLARLIDASNIDETERQSLVDSLRNANKNIGESSTVAGLANAIDQSFKDVAGPACNMSINLGLAEPSFQAIVRTLRILLTNSGMANLDPSSNGLGLNNVLYISILIEYFKRRLKQHNSAGQIILLEEPEAHLHPQLQLALYKSLSDLPFQSIITTHSTHITAQAGLDTFVTLTNVGSAAIASSRLAADSNLSPDEKSDLERYLDATKSNLLFARKVMLVEGPAELFLIPALVKAVEGIDLDREGISVIPIYGVHFDVYAKLFCAECLPKRCAIVADGDLFSSDATSSTEEIDDELPIHPKLTNLENDYVRVFSNSTTFEYAITIPGTLEMLESTAEAFKATKLSSRIRKAVEDLASPGVTANRRAEILNLLRPAVLGTAKRVGKARFAQVAARHANKATVLPKYISDALKWLREP